MNKEEVAIKTLEELIENIKNGTVTVVDVSLEMVPNEYLYISDGKPTPPTVFEHAIVWRVLPKKVYKTQREIYKELYDYIVNTDDMVTTRAANIYAVKNTDRVWKEQYE